jgi:hypothetical protein
LCSFVIVLGALEPPNRKVWRGKNPLKAAISASTGLLRDVAFEMETEDGVIWIRELGEDGVMALTDFGIENLIELIKIYKEDSTLLRR